MDWDATWQPLITALGIGLMIGLVRERRHSPELSKAGIRTHALIAVIGFVAWGLGEWPFVAATLAVGGLAVTGYFKDDDPGLTGEVALIVTLALGALSHDDPPLAATLGVTCAILLHAKFRLHRLSRELITEQEMYDALTLAAAALVVMPLLPAEPVDPWGVLKLTTLWKIVVLVMGVGMLGHIARRFMGNEWGLPVAGFFSGFASSTAAVASFGHRAKNDQRLLMSAGSAALLANLASLGLLAAVIAATSVAVIKSLAIPLTIAGAALVATAAFGIRSSRKQSDAANEETEQTRAFKLSHALAVAAMIAAVTLIAALMQRKYGAGGALIAAVLAALADLQSAAISLAQLSASGSMSMRTVQWGVVAVLASSSLAKICLAYVSGGMKYCAIVSAGLTAMVAGAAAALFWLA